jgi:site-specific recombinase XerD
MHKLDDQIDDFIFHCRYEKNLSSNSIKAYRIDLDQFITFISSKSNCKAPLFSAKLKCSPVVGF